MNKTLGLFLLALSLGAFSFAGCSGPPEATEDAGNVGMDDDGMADMEGVAGDADLDGPPSDGDAADGDAPAGDAPAGDAPAGDAPAGDAPADDAPAGDTPADDAK